MFDFTRDEHGAPLYVPQEQRAQVQLLKGFTLALQLASKAVKGKPIPKRQPPGTKN